MDIHLDIHALTCYGFSTQGIKLTQADFNVRVGQTIFYVLVDRSKK